MVVGGCYFPIYYTFYIFFMKRTIDILVTTTTKWGKSGGNLGKICWLLVWLLVVGATDQNGRPEVFLIVGDFPSLVAGIIS